MNFFLLFYKKHSLLHYFGTTFYYGVKFLLLGFFSFYIMGVGFIFSQEMAAKFLPPSVLLKINLLFDFFPCFYFVKKQFSWFLNCSFPWQPSVEWWALVFGLPLFLIGITIFLITFFDFINCVLSPFYNQTHCPFCQN